MSVVEIEYFSNNQLLILTLLMFIGGDIFISIVGLQCSIAKLRLINKEENKNDDKSNTLYPPCLRFSVWFAGKFIKKAEAKYLLESPSHEICYFHWLSARHSTLLMFSAFGFLFVQFVMFCCMEWNARGLSELNDYERFIGVLFEIVNTRYSGETILDLWSLAPAIWVLFIFMMYIPPYTCYVGANCNEVLKTKRRHKIVEDLMFSPLSYLVIFVILICITERKKIQEDPLNFNALSIVIEVVSAYGNVGYSKAYNCDAQLKRDADCVSRWIGFSGKWSDEGKLILIVTMLFGTLKKYHLNEGRSWKLM
ncbi:cation transporter HKT1;3-like [Rutidosis leptorrhynchoides]|uniref:cation transporter HKT1;3-like n=1 Tax=Rutidosis leptorrhynchoides TaxID=125765 RepID=UPI003A993FA3